MLTSTTYITKATPSSDAANVMLPPGQPDCLPSPTLSANSNKSSRPAPSPSEPWTTLLSLSQLGIMLATFTASANSRTCKEFKEILRSMHAAGKLSSEVMAELIADMTPYRSPDRKKLRPADLEEPEMPGVFQKAICIYHITCVVLQVVVFTGATCMFTLRGHPYTSIFSQRILQIVWPHPHLSAQRVCHMQYTDLS